MKKLLLILVVLLALPVAAQAKIKGHFELISPLMPPDSKSLDVVTIHEVFAFSCPHCNDFNKELPALRKYFGKKIKIISTPIGWAGHQPGRLLYIAKRHGEAKEIEVKDMIFSFAHDRGLGEGIYKRSRLKYVAKMTGLTDDFVALMDDPKIIQEMENGVAFANEKKVTGTPTLIMEGSLKVKNHTLENMKQIINSLLKHPVR